jgi:hypothetical protein
LLARLVLPITLLTRLVLPVVLLAWLVLPITLLTRLVLPITLLTMVRRLGLNHRRRRTGRGACGECDTSDGGHRNRKREREPSQPCSLVHKRLPVHMW